VGFAALILGDPGRRFRGETGILGNQCRDALRFAEVHRRQQFAGLLPVGPRGLASVLFGLLILERLDTPGSETILIVTILTVGLSILAPGITAAPAALAYGRMARAKGECAENEPVSEMPTRTGFVVMEIGEENR